MRDNILMPVDALISHVMMGVCFLPLDLEQILIQGRFKNLVQKPLYGEVSMCHTAKYVV